MTLADLTIDVISCARCNKDHPKLPFKRFRQPVDGITVRNYGGVSSNLNIFTHWAICPKTEEPILLHIIEN